MESPNQSWAEKALTPPQWKMKETKEGDCYIRRHWWCPVDSPIKFYYLATEVICQTELNTQGALVKYI